MPGRESWRPKWRVNNESAFKTNQVTIPRVRTDWIAQDPQSKKTQLSLEIGQLQILGATSQAERKHKYHDCIQDEYEAIKLESYPDIILVIPPKQLLNALEDL